MLRYNVFEVVNFYNLGFDAHTKPESVLPALPHYYSLTLPFGSCNATFVVGSQMTTERVEPAFCEDGFAFYESNNHTVREDEILAWTL